LNEPDRVAFAYVAVEEVFVNVIASEPPVTDNIVFPESKTAGAERVLKVSVLPPLLDMPPEKAMLIWVASPTTRASELKV
jgi:hypothetical protein